MDPVERQLRRKLAGLRTSQTRNMLALKQPATKDRAKKHRTKLRELNQAVKEVERQIKTYQKKSPAAATI